MLLYGELIPRSILGRLFTVPLLVFGLLLIALPSFVLGRNFAIVFDAMSNQIMQPVSTTPRDVREEHDVKLFGSLQIDAAAGGHSSRASYDQARANGPIQNTQSQHRSMSPFPRTSDSPPPTMRMADRGNMVGGLQYDALPSSDPAGPGGSGGGPSNSGGLNASGSQQSGFSLAQLEAGKTHPMFPPGEAWQGKGLTGATLDTGAAGAAAAAALTGLGKNDLTNLKLASNQQILLLEIERLREITEQQGSMMEKMMEMLGQLAKEKETKEATEG
ncbi:hypothetical protein QFC22_002822 [Naganishia vaughanmartiniae]|uniref:Uncharacterized protein n=1 Tax=Naganishia vaughanmartiniae TaxID=1424756 RepID=A0ACC2XDS5_9TREE|nr:hypothetical protein QFC22_002822 [Naganishia vaughanmartiniae]